MEIVGEDEENGPNACEVWSGVQNTQKYAANSLKAVFLGEPKLVKILKFDQDQKWPFPAKL